jgi:PAS domain S-box-containing protein
MSIYFVRTMEILRKLEYNSEKIVYFRMSKKGDVYPYNFSSKYLRLGAESLGVGNMNRNSKIFLNLDYLIEKKGSLILNVISGMIGIRLFFEMNTLNHKLMALSFFTTIVLASFFRKKPLLFYPFMTISILLFTLTIIFSKVDFFTLLFLVNNFLIVSAFLFPNPFSIILLGAVFTSLLLTYQDTLSFYFIKGSLITVTINTILYSIFAYLIKYLFKKKLEVQESEKDHLLLLNMLPDPLVIHQDGKMVFINQEGLRLIGAKNMEEMLHKSILQFVIPDYHDALKERISTTYAVKVSQTPFEIKIINLKQEIMDIETTGVAINYHSKPAILTIARDITALKSQTDELILKSDKLSLVGQLAAGIAHEIRNPLTSLRGFIQLLQYKSEDNQDYCEIMLSELDRINLIVGEFLILAKPQMVQFNKKDVNQIIRHVVTLIGTQAIMNNIHLDYKLATNLPTISCEENQLKQVIINLIKNSIEAMPKGGTITVETGMHDNDNIFIKVSDEGQGIPKDMLTKLGEPFYTTKEHGTGLGLMVCYKIIENHLGQLRVDSTLNEGTTFDIILRTSFSHGELEASKIS